MVLGEAVIVSSYVFLPSLLIFIPKMQEYKAGGAGSDEFG